MRLRFIDATHGVIRFRPESRYSDIQGGNTRRSNIYHVFRCWSAMQINPQLKRWNFETRRFKACVCIYISLQDIVLSFTRDRASDDFKQWNQKFGNCVYLTSNKFAWLYSIIEERDEFVRCQARVLMMLRKKGLVNCQINL